MGYKFNINNILSKETENGMFEKYGILSHFETDILILRQKFRNNLRIGAGDLASPAPENRTILSESFC